MYRFIRACLILWTKNVLAVNSNMIVLLKGNIKVASLLSIKIDILLIISGNVWHWWQQFQVCLPGKENVACRAAFAGIHGISLACVRRLSEATLESPCPPRDLRGKHKQHACIPDNIKEKIDQHIRSFPAMKSHYSRSYQNQCCKYLSPFLKCMVFMFKSMKLMLKIQ